MTVKPVPRQLIGRYVGCEQMRDLGRLDLDESFGVSATQQQELIRRYWASLLERVKIRSETVSDKGSPLAIRMLR
jgi:hypothetical protein